MIKDQRALSRVLSVVARVVAAGFAVAACSLEQQHGYVQSPDESLSFRHPVEWEQLEVASRSSEWAIGIDAGDHPAGTGVSDALLESPFVRAEVLPLDEEDRDVISLAGLRAVNLEQGEADPLLTEDPSFHLLFHETFRDDNGFEGHHMRFELDDEDGTSVREDFAVLDPERARIQRVQVACSQVCFNDNAPEIEALFTSVRLQP